MSSRALTDRVYHPEIMAMPVEEIAIRDFFKMLEYSTSLPTGTTMGKRWRRAVGRRACPSGWLTGEYGDVVPESGGTLTTILWRRVVFSDAPENAAIYLTGYVGHELWEGTSDRMAPGALITSTTLDGLLSGLARLAP